MRLLLISLAVVIAVLAFVLNQVWLYWAAGALLLAAVVVVVVRMWQRYQEAMRFQREEGQAAPRHPDLSELGIMEVRQKADEPAAQEEPPPAEDAPSSRASTGSAEPVTDAADGDETPGDASAAQASREQERDPERAPGRGAPLPRCRTTAAKGCGVAS